MKMRAGFAILFLSTGTLLAATELVRVVPTGDATGRVDVEARRARLSRVLGALEMRLGVPVTLAAADTMVDFRAKGILPAEALQRLAAQSGLEASEAAGGWVVRDPAEPAVTLDVVDEEVRAILASVKKQCGIRNILVDPNVTGRGTFLFDEVPCSLALKTIFASLGLESESYPSVVRVKER